MGINWFIQSPTNMIQNHLNSLGNYLNELCKKYDNFILLGDFNSEMCEDAMPEFSSVYNLKNLVKNPRVIRI